MTVSEVKEEFGGDVKKYIDWEIWSFKGWNENNWK